MGVTKTQSEKYTLYIWWLSVANGIAWALVIILLIDRYGLSWQ